MTNKKIIADSIMRSRTASLVIAIAGIFAGIFFILYQNSNKPIERKEAVSYSGLFEAYEIRKNSREIYFDDGSCYSFYPHTESDEFREKMKSLDKGTKLYILINPNNNYVVEIKTASEELLNFESSQEEIASYGKVYIIIGVFMCASGVFLIFYTLISTNYKRKEDARHASKKSKIKDTGVNSIAIRLADPDVKNKILLETVVKGYRICYRRVKSVNELVINEKVYDEKKGIIEFEHKLTAALNGHSFEAGYDENDYSYIMFDGEIIEYKKRLI